MRLALVGGFHIAVEQHDINAVQRGDIADAGAHEARADNADLFDLRLRLALGAARALVQFAHGHEERADHRARFRRAQDAGEPAALDLEREVHRQLQAFIDGMQDGLGRRIIVLCLAAINGIGRRPHHHAGGRIDLSGRRAEFRIIPRRKALIAGRDPCFGLRQQFGLGCDGVDEVHGLRRLCADLLALEQHLQGVTGGHQPGDALRATGTGKQADLDFRQADAGLRTVGCDPVMTGQRQFEGTAEADTVNGSDPRLAAGLEPAIEQRQPARAIEKSLYRSLFSMRADHVDIAAAGGFQHAEIGASGEGLLAGDDDAALDGGICRDLHDDAFEFVHHLFGDDVHRTARHIPDQRRDAGFVRLEAEIGQVHIVSSPLLFKRVR